MHHNQVPMANLHNKIVEDFRKTLGEECTTVRMLEAADVTSTGDVPPFTEHQLHFLRSLMAVQQTEAPITKGFEQSQLMDYAMCIGRYNGMLDQLAYIISLIENQLDPQPQE